MICGTLLFGTGSYASIQHASIAAVGSGAAEGGLSWFELVSWVGIALMALGVVSALVVVLLFAKTMLTPTSYVSSRKDSRSSVRIQSVQSHAMVKPEVDDIVSILNRILEVEYANVVDCPRWVSRLEELY